MRTRYGVALSRTSTCDFTSHVQSCPVLQFATPRHRSWHAMAPASRQATVTQYHMLPHATCHMPHATCHHMPPTGCAWPSPTSAAPRRRPRHAAPPNRRGCAPAPRKCCRTPLQCCGSRRRREAWVVTASAGQSAAQARWLVARGRSGRARCRRYARGRRGS